MCTCEITIDGIDCEQIDLFGHWINQVTNNVSNAVVLCDTTKVVQYIVDNVIINNRVFALTTNNLYLLMQLYHDCDDDKIIIASKHMIGGGVDLGNVDTVIDLTMTENGRFIVARSLLECKDWRNYNFNCRMVK